MYLGMNNIYSNTLIYIYSFLIILDKSYVDIYQNTSISKQINRCEGLTNASPLKYIHAINTH